MSMVWDFLLDTFPELFFCIAIGRPVVWLCSRFIIFSPCDECISIFSGDKV